MQRAGLLDQTYAVAARAEVIQLFLASSTAVPPSTRAVLTGAQKCEREPASENASVDRCLPATTSRRTVSLPWVSSTATPAKCIVSTIAELPHSRATRSTTWAAARRPRPWPPTAALQVMPSTPALRAASMVWLGKAPVWSMARACSWAAAAATASAAARES